MLVRVKLGLLTLSRAAGAAGQAAHEGRLAATKVTDERDHLTTAQFCANLSGDS